VDNLSEEMSTNCLPTPPPPTPNPPGTLDRDEWNFNINSLAPNPSVNISADLVLPGPGRMRVLDPSSNQINCAFGPLSQFSFNATSTGTYTIEIFNNGPAALYQIDITSQNEMSDLIFIFNSMCDFNEQNNACP